MRHLRRPLTPTSGAYDAEGMSWVRVLFRSAGVAVVGVAATIVAAISAVIAARRGKDATVERIIDAWSMAWLKAGRVNLEVRGADKVDPARSYVVVANHASAFDIMACFKAVPIPIRFLAKKELFRIPLLATAMRAIGIVEVDRQARVGIQEQISAQAKELIAKGRSVIIYPEGTRTKTGVMGPFKKGAFTIAISSGLPVLPVTVLGSYAAWRPGTMWVRGGDITVIIDDPIETEGLPASDTGELRDRARQVIASRLVPTQS